MLVFHSEQRKKRLDFGFQIQKSSASPHKKKKKRNHIHVPQDVHAFMDARARANL
jgi:hypothetical protein